MFSLIVFVDDRMHCLLSRSKPSSSLHSTDYYLELYPLCHRSLLKKVRNYIVRNVVRIISTMRIVVRII